MLGLRLTIAALLLNLFSLTVAHGDSAHGAMNMGGIRNSTNSTYGSEYEQVLNLPNYAGLDSHTGSLLAHIVLEIIAWFFVLPLGS
jgi:hypothetical protein